MKSCGESDETIAAALDVSPSQLRKHYRHQLDHGLAHQRRQVIAMLWSAARQGNVAAIKHIEHLTRIAGAASSFVDRVAPKVVPGKKEAAKAAAESAGDGSEWGEDLKVPGIRPN